MAKKKPVGRGARKRGSTRGSPFMDRFGRRYLFHPITGEPWFDVDSPPLSEEERERIQKQEKERLRKSSQERAARRAVFDARVGRRPKEMRSEKYELPEGVAAFLELFFRNPLLFSKQGDVSVEEVVELVRSGYMEGCRQGFIEGFLYGEEKARPGALKNRERLRQQNLEKLERLGIADRNAAIVRQFNELERESPGIEQRKEILADKYDLTPRQIGNILKKRR